jgi:hypothetical protein
MGFKVKTSRAVGTTAEVVGNYTATGEVTVIGLSVANIVGTDVLVTVTLFDGTNSTAVLKNATVVPGQTQVLVGGDQKIVLETGYSVKVVSDTAASLDVIMSILEM